MSQVKDADLLCRVLGDVREAPRGQKPRQGPVDYIKTGSRMSPQVCETGNLVWLSSSGTETLVLRFESKAFNIWMSLYILETVKLICVLR